MSKPMLEVKKGASSSQTVPNLLPCHIPYDGPVEPIQAFWSPSEVKDGTKVAYFRGRKLHGKTVKLPEGYRGVVAEKGDVKTPAPRQPEPEVIDLDQEGGGEDPVPTGTLETKAEFEEVVVWGHETMADVVSDPYVRSMEEWLALADQIHSYPTTPSQKS